MQLGLGSKQDVNPISAMLLALLMLLGSIVMMPKVAADDLVAPSGVVPSKALMPVRFGTFSHPPYAYLDEHKNYVGSLYEVANAILSRAELTGENRVLPPKRLFQQLLNKQTDCSLMIYNQTTSSHFSMLAPLGENLKAGILASAGNKLDSYQDLSALNIAVPRATHIYPPFDQDDQLHKTTTQNYYHSALMLSRGRVDAMAGGIESMLFNVYQLDIPKQDLAEPLIFDELPIWLLCSPGALAEDIETRLVKAVESLRKAGEIKRIFQQHQVTN